MTTAPAKERTTPLRAPTPDLYPKPDAMIGVRLSWESRPGTVRSTDFEIMMGDVIELLLAGKLVTRRREHAPNARLKHALEEAQKVEPRFATPEELFDALEAEGQG